MCPLGAFSKNSMQETNCQAKKGITYPKRGTPSDLQNAGHCDKPPFEAGQGCGGRGGGPPLRRAVHGLQQCHAGLGVRLVGPLAGVDDGAQPAYTR